MSSITPSMEAVMALSSLQSNVLKKVDLRLNVHGISFTEFLILRQLHSAHAKTLRRIDLAEAVGLSASGVTRLLLPMEKNHLVTKEANPRDARVSLVKLSNTGEQIYGDALVSFKHIADGVMDGLDAKQLQQLLGLIKALQ